MTERPGTTPPQGTAESEELEELYVLWSMVYITLGVLEYCSN